jgi:hypothetical protein
VAAASCRVRLKVNVPQVLNQLRQVERVSWYVDFLQASFVCLILYLKDTFLFFFFVCVCVSHLRKVRFRNSQTCFVVHAGAGQSTR